MSSPQKGTPLPRSSSDSRIPSPPPDPTHIFLPSPQTASVSDMIEDADAFHITIPTSPHPSPPLSPSRSPLRRQSPQLSPRPSPNFKPEKSTVSFSEYVASELARDQTLPDPFVSFAPAARPDSTAASRPQRQLSDPFDSDSDDAQPKNIIEHSADIPRSETEPNLPTCKPKSEISQTHTAANDLFSHYAATPSHVFSGVPSKGRYGKLDCIEIDEHGNSVSRQMSRTDILQEARSTLPGAQPSPHVVNRWLNSTGKMPSPDLKQFSKLFEPLAITSRKAAQKALRDYLRNSLQARDIRQVDPAFAAKPALWVRHSAIVVSLEGLRSIILPNKMFLFDPSSEKTKKLAFIAKQSIMARPEGETPQPFEFRALEGILIFLVMGLEVDFGKLKPDIDEYLHQMPNELTTKMLEELRRQKQQLNQFHSRANIVRTVLENLLDDDEEMANMYLTEKHMSQNYARNALDHSEVETLLEAYLQTIDLHVNHASLLNDAIEDTEDLIMIHLDTLRNRLLSVELAMSVVSMMFGFGGVVAGIFGMNINIPMFEASASRFWFLGVVLLITVTVVSVSWMVLVMLRRRGLYSFY